MDKVLNKKSYIIFALISVLIMCFRFMPMPANFTPLFGWAIFSGAFFAKNKWGLILPLALLVVFDLMVGFHGGALVVWGSFIAISFVSQFVLKNKKVSYPRVLGASVFAPLFFFITTNFEVWLSSGMYLKTMEGLISCYAAAIPFYHASQVSSLVFTGAFFTAWHLVKKNQTVAAAKHA
jgi:hypothetical protein